MYTEVSKESMLLLLFACIPKSSTPSIPTPPWASSTPVVQNNRACATTHYALTGNLNLARSTAIARAREELRYPIAEMMLPYSETIDLAFATEYKLVEVNPQEKTSVLKLQYQTETEMVEVLPPANPTVLWTKVCVDLNKETFTSEFNQVWLAIHSKSISSQGGKATEDQLRSIEEKLILLQQQFLTEGIEP